MQNGNSLIKPKIKLLIFESVHGMSYISVYDVLKCKTNKTLMHFDNFFPFLTKASITTVGGQTFYQKGCASTCTAGQLISYFNNSPFNSRTACCTGVNCNDGVLF